MLAYSYEINKGLRIARQLLLDLVSENKIRRGQLELKYYLD